MSEDIRKQTNALLNFFKHCLITEASFTWRRAGALSPWSASQIQPRICVIWPMGLNILAVGEWWQAWKPLQATR